MKITKKTIFQVLLVLMAAAVFAVPTCVADTYWTDGDSSDSDWSTAGNWDAGEPTILDIAGVKNGGTVYITQTGEVCERVQLGNGVSTSGNVNMTSGTLYADVIAYIGYSGQLAASTFTQSGGDTTINGNLTIGRNTGAEGAYVQSGGTVDVAGNLLMGYLTGAAGDAYGSYTLTGDNTVTLDIGGYAWIGNTGNATFTQEGGAVTVTGEIVVANGEDGQGTYNQSGGTLNANNALVVGKNKGTDGTYIQSGGEVYAVGGLDLGASGTTASGEYRLSGDDTVLLQASSREYIGGWGTGTFKQTGGTHDVSTNYVYLGTNKNSTGIYDLQAGDFLNARLYVGRYGTGIFTQSGGYHESKWIWIGNGSTAGGTYTQTGGTTKLTSQSIRIGDNDGSVGRYNLSGTGILDATGFEEHVGYGGIGIFTQTGGSNTASAIHLGRLSTGAGKYTQSSGTTTVTGDLRIGNYSFGDEENQNLYDLQGGDLSTARTLIGGYTTYGAGKGTFLQSGGTHETGQLSLGMGIDSASEGIYTQTGGSLVFTANTGLLIGQQSGATGTYTFQGGTITDGTNNANMTMRNKATSSGTFEGRGVVDLSGTITNNGRVIANGYGVDSTLDLSSFSGIANTVDNIDANGSTDNGWFVEDHGKLVLPAFTIASGDSTRYWGEDGDLDLVNAVKMDFHGVTGGDLSISLIDRDHAEMPTFDVTGSPGTPAVLLGGWYFDTSGGFDFGTGTVDLTFRYDDALADLLVGFTEGDTKLYHYTGGAWVEESFTLYTENNYLEVTGVNSFSFRSLGNDKIEQQFGAVPEPGTVVFLLAGIGLAVRKRLTK